MYRQMMQHNGDWAYGPLMTALAFAVLKPLRTGFQWRQNHYSVACEAVYWFFRSLLLWPNKQRSMTTDDETSKMSANPKKRKQIRRSDEGKQSIKQSGRQWGKSYHWRRFAKVENIYIMLQYSLITVCVVQCTFASSSVNCGFTVLYSLWTVCRTKVRTGTQRLEGQSFSQCRQTTTPARGQLRVKP